MKKINLILFEIGICLTINYGIGYSLLIPILLYFIHKEINNAIYLYPTILITTFFLNKSYLIEILIIEVILLLFIILLNKVKKYKIIFYILFIIIINLLFFKTININLIYILLSVIIFLFLYFEDYIYFNNIVKEQTLYSEHIIVIVSVLGFIKLELFNISFGLIFALYFAIYYIRKYKSIQSLILTFILFLILFLGFNYFESILILIIAFMFLLDSNYLFFIVNILLMILTFSSDNFNTTILYSFMITTIIFEVLWLIFYKQKYINKMNNNYYNLLINNLITNEYNTFSKFLEFFTNEFKNKKIYIEQLSKSIDCIIERHCNNCTKQSECYKQNKYDIVCNLKNIIENKEISLNFKNNCLSLQGIKQTAEGLSNQMVKEKDYSNIILLAVLNELKQILNKYQNEITNKLMIDFKIIENFHNKLYNCPFDIKQINYHKLYLDDFYIEVIIKKSNKYIVKDLKLLIESSIKIKCRIEIIELEFEILFNIYPIQKIHIKYGYGNLSSKQTELCGDNYIIKNYPNGHFLACISDGMGKGYKAFEDSRRVLELLDSLCNCATSISTNVEILNLLYILQGYTERYSTLDAIDINRTTLEANIFKLGASNTYIFHDNLSYTKIENKSLPLGIEETIEHKKINLINNDLIVFSSDGIFENIVDEEKLIELIKNIKNELPQKIAYEILEFTLSNKTKVKDDMSVIVLKIEQIK